MYWTIMPRKPVSIEISELRKRVRAAIEQSRRAAAARRLQMDEAAKAYAEFLEQLAAPLVQMLANALRAEGYAFTVFTPAGGLRLATSTSGDDFIEFALDTQSDPFAILRVTRTRGRRVVQHERPIRGHTLIEHLTEEDVLHALFEEIGPFVER